MFIIENIIIDKHPNRIIHWIFFSYHCKISKSITNNLKDLSILRNVFNIDEFTDDNTYIIDDNIDVYNTQPTMCIEAEPFNVFNDGSESDTFLIRIRNTLDLLK